MTVIHPALNPALKAQDIAQVFARDRRVHIPEILTPEVRCGYINAWRRKPNLPSLPATAMAMCAWVRAPASARDRRLN